MKIEFIKRGAETRLILIFAGWSTDARYYNDCVADGWDTAVVSDYRDMAMPPVPSQYTTVYIFAYSLGVAAAARCRIPAAVRVAICGSLQPVSDEFGIPQSVYTGTHDGLCERSLMKFHLRMAGDKATYEFIRSRLPENPDIEHLKEELLAIMKQSEENEFCTERVKFDRAYIAEDDRIFPPKNLRSCWNKHGETEIITLKASHAIDLSSIIHDCLPDTKAIGEGFSRACKSYNENAVVQKEICDRICDKLGAYLSESDSGNLSLLEIGVGSGLLTKGWRRILTPEKATYIDLTAMQEFKAAKEERYIKADAERWLEKTDETFDIILSASTIQWFADPVRFVLTVRHHLNPGGIAILSTFVKGNLKELDALRPSPILYRTAEEYREIPGMQIEGWERTMTFMSSREMLMHLRLTGVSPHRNSTTSLLKNLPTALTYNPLILIIPSD